MKTEPPLSSEAVEESPALGAVLPWELPSPAEEASIFGWAKRRAARTVVLQTLSRAWFRVWLVIGLGSLLWLGLFALFREGFHFLIFAIPYTDLVQQTIHYIFGTFFLTLGLMLILSSAIMLHGSLFRGRDTPFLLTLPVHAERIFLDKYMDAVFLSSWAFVMLGSPLLLAYAAEVGAPWYHYWLLLPYLVSFVYIPAAVGGLVSLLLALFFPRSRTLLWTLGIILGFLAAVAVGRWVFTLPHAMNAFSLEWLQRTFDRLSITQFRFLPSWWLSSGLLASAEGNWQDGVLFLSVLVANALFLNYLIGRFAGAFYREAYWRVAAGPSNRKVGRSGWIDAVILNVLPGLSEPVRQLILKDVRLFRRDPVQWTQILIFIGLLVFYFVNIRRLYDEQFFVAWVNVISFLNLAVIVLLLSTFTTRFIFPLISLEGPRFWVLGLMPIPRSTIVWSKLWFALSLCLPPTCALVAISDLMLGVSATVHLHHQYATVLAAVGLCSIAVGLGARFPMFKVASPTQIAAGFGGTVNLILSTAYNVVIIGLAGLPIHVQAILENTILLPTVTAHVPMNRFTETWLSTGPAWAAAVAVFATSICLSLGLRFFTRL
ncbi:MAG: hypothetical protein GYA33_10150, partial [Thermogutta sp.]|nr:hypothetical protein [Thermogutta sp.]